jgi:hypothetical protein
VDVAVLVLAAIIEALLAIITEWPETVRSLDTVLVLARAGDDRTLEATILYRLGLHNLRHGDYGPAKRLLDQALSIALEQDEPDQELLAGIRGRSRMRSTTWV